tara:strand:+ start:1908 stop:3140 length:1233 start_codon:yes stop_codon:yes gene_type:complete
MSSLILHNTNLDGNYVQFDMTGSKSISQRALIIHSLMGLPFTIKGLSDSEDTLVLLKALSSSDYNINVQYSGTALRFLLTLFAYRNQLVILTGQETLFNRPIESLIKALNSLGAQIIKKHNFIHIEKSDFHGGVVNFDDIKSSQFISSLLLIAPYLKGGLTLNLPSNYNSKSYVYLTTSMMLQCGARVISNNSSIKVLPSSYTKGIVEIESDWTSVSYLFVAFLFSELKTIQIRSFLHNSLQPDSIVADFFTILGVKTTYKNNNLILEKINNVSIPNKIEWNFKNNGDLFPAIIVACVGLRINLLATGIHTLAYKESDRIVSMTTELSKFNCFFSIEKKSVYMDSSMSNSSMQKNIINIDTYQDHRIALSIAPLVLLNWDLKISNFEIVNKSYPNFWIDLVKFGVKIKKY